nr:hypothetical protein [Acinetobacter sp. Marseille-Q1620]
MTFQNILNKFETLSSGTDAFKQLKIDCEHQILKDPSSLENTALYIIYGFAKTYVLLYEDQAVSTDFSSTAKAQLLEYMHRLNDAFLTQQSENILLTLNEISTHYLKSDRVF